MFSPNNKLYKFGYNKPIKVSLNLGEIICIFTGVQIILFFNVLDLFVVVVVVVVTFFY